MDFLKQPVARDTTPNPPGEILRRLAVLAHPATLFGAPVLLAFGGAQGSIPMLATGAAFGVAGLALHLTRKRWGPARRAGKPSANARPTPVPDTPSPVPVAGDAEARPRIVLLNASLAGAEGNSARLLARVATRLAPHATLLHATLAGPAAPGFAQLAPLLRGADGFVIATGTHWDAWSSPLQKFLEDATPAETTDLWLGKPAAVLVSEHSTGGKGVLSRLQGVLVTLGCAIPPLSGLVIAKSAQIAGRTAPAEADDFWCADDLAVVADNLLTAARQPRPVWRVWPVDRANFTAAWFESGA